MSNKNITQEIKARLISLIDGKFFLTLLVFLVTSWFLVNSYLESTAYATIITGGIFAYDITNNESYSQILLDKVKDQADKL